MTNPTQIFDPERFRLESENPVKEELKEADAVTPLPRHKPGEKFLKGPIPLTWINAAAALPGRALHVGISIWFRVGIEGKNQVRLSQKLLREMGVRRHAAYRGLAALETAGLVQVERKDGRCSIVTLI